MLQIEIRVGLNYRTYSLNTVARNLAFSGPTILRHINKGVVGGSFEHGLDWRIVGYPWPEDPCY